MKKKKINLAKKLIEKVIDETIDENAPRGIKQNLTYEKIMEYIEICKKAIDLVDGRTLEEKIKFAFEKKERREYRQLLLDALQHLPILYIALADLKFPLVENREEALVPVMTKEYDYVEEAIKYAEVTLNQFCPQFEKFVQKIYEKDSQERKKWLNVCKQLEAEVCFNIGTWLCKIGRNDAAIKYLEKAVWLGYGPKAEQNLKYAQEKVWRSIARNRRLLNKCWC